MRLAFERLKNDGDAGLESSILGQYPTGAKEYIENWLYTLPECKEFHAKDPKNEYLLYPVEKFVEFLEQKFPE